jgi:hypothetical protein
MRGLVPGGSARGSPGFGGESRRIALQGRRHAPGRWAGGVEVHGPGRRRLAPARVKRDLRERNIADRPVRGGRGSRSRANAPGRFGLDAARGRDGGGLRSGRSGGEQRPLDVVVMRRAGRRRGRASVDSRRRGRPLVHGRARRRRVLPTIRGFGRLRRPWKSTRDPDRPFEFIVSHEAHGPTPDGITAQRSRVHANRNTPARPRPPASTAGGLSSERYVDSTTAGRAVRTKSPGNPGDPTQSRRIARWTSTSACSPDYSPSSQAILPAAPRSRLRAEGHRSAIS